MKYRIIWIGLVILLGSCSFFKGKKKVQPTPKYEKIIMTPEDFAVYGLEKAKVDGMTIHDFEGRWKMTMWSAFVTYIWDEDNPIPEPGECGIEWYIDAENSTVTITKQITDSKNDYSRDPGTYSFQVDPSGYIFIDGIEYGYGLDEDELVLDSNLDPTVGGDEPVIQFTRV